VMILNTTAAGTTGQLVGLDGQPLYGGDEDDAHFHEDEDSFLDRSPGDVWRGQQCGGQDSEEFCCCRPDQPDRPALTVADVFRQFGPEYRSLHGRELTVQQDRVLRELMACRTEAIVCVG